MRFAWQSNAPWAGTGYGGQTRLMLRELLRMGHDPQCFCYYGLSGGAIMYDGYTCWPNSDYDPWMNDVVKAHMDRSEAEALVTLIDLFVLHPETWAKLEKPWLAWVPVDCVGVGSKTLQLLNICDYPIAMSDFGREQMMENNIDVASRIYHAIDTDVFKPLEDPAEKDEIRSFFDLDADAFVILMVMANKGDRKQYPLQLKAIKQWIDENPDRKVQVYIHSEPTSMMGGWDLRELTRVLGLSGKVFATNQYDASVVPMMSTVLVKLFQMADVLMNASSGEGFGIPIIEAQACGVPVITGNYTSMPELTHYGYAVEPQSSGLGGHFGWQFHPSVDEMVYRLECVYRMDNKAARVDAATWARSMFDSRVIAAQWALAIELAIEQGKKIGPTPAKMPEPVS